MRDYTLSRLGGTCSILLAISIIVVGITYLPLPPEQQQIVGLYTNPGAFLESFAKNSTLLTVEFWAEALGALFGIAAVLAISESVRASNEGWVRWTSTLAIIGLAIAAIDDLRFLALMPGRAMAYVQSDAATKAALTVPGILEGIDPQHWLRLGAVGFWVLVVSFLALRSGTWPKLLAYVGIGAAIAYWLAVAGIVFQLPSVLTIIAGLGGIFLAPLWYIWLGLRLRQAGRERIGASQSGLTTAPG
ncbi:MAG TPA: DUF4386 family protein [Anaerolineae bacterium]